MDIEDSTLGKWVSVSTLLGFVSFVFWTSSYPLIDKDLPIFNLIPNPQWFLLLCAVWGLFFIGGLMTFTLYHIYPHLRQN